jgi:hypothetical protein
MYANKTICNMKHLITHLKTFSFLALMALVVSCSKSDDPKARIMAVHASPNAPGVDVLVDNTKVNSSALTFPNNSGYLSVNAGTRNIKINVAGTSTTVINANLSVVADKNYTVFAVDSVAKISAIAVEDNLATPASGKAHIRFFHLSPNAPSVDVGVLNGSTFTGVFNNRSFETQSSAAANAAFTPVDAGTYTFQVRVAGTSTVALTIPGVTLQAGKIYTVFAKGFLGGAGAEALGAQIINNN